VQQFGKGLRGGAEVKAFSRSVVVGGDEGAKAPVWQGRKIGLAWQEAAHTADGVLDAALLPGRIRVAEEGLDRQVVQNPMAGELGSIVEGDGLAQRLRQDTKQAEEMTSDAVRGLVGEPDCQQEAGLALVHGQDRLTVFCEHHQVGFPMTAGLAVGGLDRPICYGNTAFNEVRRASALPAATAAFALATRQIPAPAIILGAGKLGINEAIDALIGDHLPPMLDREPASDLLRRPTACQPLHDVGSQTCLTFQTGTLPAPRVGSLVSVAGSVPNLGTTVAIQLPRNR
jgi:hypothetical protein